MVYRRGPRFLPPGDPGGNKRSAPEGKGLPHASSVLATVVQAGHSPAAFTMGVGYQGVLGLMDSLKALPPDDWLFKTVFRHSDRSKYHKGPNVLFADAHVKARADFWTMNDDNFSVPMR